MKIGAITVGQAPRVDVTADILPILGEEVELLQRGGLDGLSREEISAFAPKPDDYVLVSRMTDGSSVTFAERCVLPRLQAAIQELEGQGVELIMVFCTGKFPETLTATVPLIYPCELLHRIVPLFTGTGRVIAVTPSPLQVAQNQEKWKKYVGQCTSIAASPYGPWEALQEAARVAKNLEGDLIVLDCIGFSQKMKELFAKETGKRVILPRTLLARVVSEIVDRS